MPTRTQADIEYIRQLLQDYLDAVKNLNVSDDILQHLPNQTVAIAQSVLLEKVESVLQQFNLLTPDFPKDGVCHAMSKMYNACNSEDKKAFFKGLVLISLHDASIPTNDFSYLILTFYTCARYLQIDYANREFSEEELVQYLQNPNDATLRQKLDLPFLLNAKEIRNLFQLLITKNLWRNKGSSFFLSTDEHTTAGTYKDQTIYYEDVNFLFGEQPSRAQADFIENIRQALAILSYEKFDPNDDESYLPLDLSTYINSISKEHKTNLELFLSELMPDFGYWSAAHRVGQQTNMTAIWLAAQSGNVRAIELFLKFGVDPNQPQIKRDDKGNIIKVGYTPLMVAIGNRHFDAMWALLTCFKSKSNMQNMIEIDLHAKTSSQDTALHVAANTLDVKYVQALLQNIDEHDLHRAVNIANNQGMTPFYIAHQYNKPDIIKALLEYTPTAGDQALLSAVRNGNIDDVVTFLTTYPQISNRKNVIFELTTGKNAIEIAVETNNAQMLELLLKNGFDPNIPNPLTLTSPLFTVIAAQNVEMFDLLVKYFPHILLLSDPRTFNTPLHVAVAGTNEYFVTEICKAKRQSINAYNYEAALAGETPLYIAVKEQKLRFAEILLEQGANPEKGRKDSSSPSLDAVINQDEAMLRLLHKHNAKINAVDQYKQKSLLSVATKAKSTEIVNTLIELGADVDNQQEYDMSNRTSLYYAIRNEDVELCRLLLEKGANPNKLFDGEIWPLEMAMEKTDNVENEKARIEIVKLLLQHGAVPTLKSSDNNDTLFEIAQSNHDDDVVWLMQFYQLNNWRDRIDFILNVQSNPVLPGIGLSNPVSQTRIKLLQAISQLETQLQSIETDDVAKQLESATQQTIANLLSDASKEFTFATSVQTAIDRYTTHIAPPVAGILNQRPVLTSEINALSEQLLQQSM